MTKRMRYIQLAGDALIPLLGFFWWNWSLYFIILFYIADLIIGEVVTHIKARKIADFQQEGKFSFSNSLISVFLLLTAILLVHFGISLFHADLDFLKEMIAFWEYKDMGIQQGYILLPLLILIAYQRYKLEFLMPARYRNMSSNMLWRNQYRVYLALIAGAGLAIGSAVFFPLSDLVLLFGIIILSTLYQLLLPD
jgi:hypothetical protein